MTCLSTDGVDESDKGGRKRTGKGVEGRKREGGSYYFSFFDTGTGGGRDDESGGTEGTERAGSDVDELGLIYCQSWAISDKGWM